MTQLFHVRSFAKRSKVVVVVFSLFIGCLSIQTINARVMIVSPMDYLASAKQLIAGDSLLLLPGNYKNGLKLTRIHGQEKNPIVIGAFNPSKRPKFIGKSSQNTISIVDSSYIIIRDFELDGRGSRASAVKAEGHGKFSHHITLENLFIYDYNGSQQAVGISTKSTAWNWVIQNNVLENIGTGIYLGNSNGKAPFVAGLIQNNLVTGTIGYNLQIKHQIKRPAIKGLPTERNITIIRHNVFSKDEGSSEREWARPNVLVGHWPLEGAGKDDEYLVYGNFFWQNRSEALFQGEGNVSLYSNIFVNHLGDAIHIQPHNDVPKHIAIFHNTIVGKGNGVRILPKKKSILSLHIIGNFIFSGWPIQSQAEIGVVNIIGERNDAVKFLQNPLASLWEPVNLQPINDKIFGSVAPAIPTELLGKKDVRVDFEGKSNILHHYIGAYLNQYSNGWQLQLARMPER